MAEEKNLMRIDDAADDELLRKFFASSQHMHIADNGFSHRVMQNLPVEMPLRQRRIYNLWTATCMAACMLTFFLGSGIDMIKGCLHNLMGSVTAFMSSGTWHEIANAMSTQNIHLQGMPPLLIIIMVAVMGAVALYDVVEP